MPCSKHITFQNLVLIASNQCRQRRDAAAAGDEQLGNCTVGQSNEHKSALCCRSQFKVNLMRLLKIVLVVASWRGRAASQSGK
jgi:hypothetical protein